LYFNGKNLIFHKVRRFFFTFYFLTITLSFLLTGCTKIDRNTFCLNDPKTLNEIIQSGEITVITRNNPYCYYFHKDQPMGFEYDLAKAFAEFLGVKLKIRVIATLKEMVQCIEQGSGDFIAASLAITEKNKKHFAFSNNYLTIQQCIIINRKNPKIKNINDLYGATVHIEQGTSHHEHLEQLKKQGFKIDIVAYNNLSTEDLIRKVAEKKIQITVSDSRVAFLNRRYYPQIAVKKAINKTDHLGWAVDTDSIQLLKQINSFFKFMKKTGKFDELYNKYFANIDSFDYVDLITYHTRLRTRLPKYEFFIKEAAKKYGFDWKIIAAQIYQESHFNPKAKSFAGAYGLMQLTSITARSLGVKNPYDPEQNIFAGVKYLNKLYNLFDKSNSSCRLLLAFAAYNIGQGHITDAQNLVIKMNRDPNKWSAVAEVLPLLRHSKYYKHTKYGYCRGTEPLQYIKKIMIYYDILKHNITNKEDSTSISYLQDGKQKYNYLYDMPIDS